MSFVKIHFYENLFYVAVNTGLRPGELFALMIDDIDLETGYINVNKTLVYQKYLDDECKTFRIETPKTKQSFRKVPINSVCRVYLEKQLELKKIISRKRPKQQNDFSIFSGHTFRHTFATRCFEVGVEPKVVQDYLGHASLKMTMDLYTHVTESKSFHDIEKIVPSSKDNVVDFKF